MKQAIIAILTALGFENIRYSGQYHLVYYDVNFRTHLGFAKPIEVTLTNFVDLWTIAFNRGKVSQGMSMFAIANSTSLVKPNYLVFDK
jgi:hypothetical protein